MTRTVPITKLLPNTGSWKIEDQHIPQPTLPYSMHPLIEIEKDNSGIIYYVPTRVEKIGNGKIETVTDESRDVKRVVFAFDPGTQLFSSVDLKSFTVNEARIDYAYRIHHLNYKNPYTLPIA